MLDILNSVLQARDGIQIHGGEPAWSVRDSVTGALLAAILDEVDYPMLLVAEGLEVLHANRTAMTELDHDHPLQLVGRRLRVQDGHDATALQDSVDAALRRGLRRLMIVGQRVGEPAWLAVVPLQRTGPADALPSSQRAALLVLGKRRVCQALSMQSFARSHGLTSTETAVLEALCEGTAPEEIARRHGVHLCTVRTQINAVRAKTGAASMRDLVRQVAVLPPILGLFFGEGARAGSPDAATDAEAMPVHPSAPLSKAMIAAVPCAA